MNRQDELKALIMSALDKTHGVITEVTGDQPNRRQLALTALITAKRELLPDNPSLINVVIKPVAASPDQIAIIRITPGDFLDV